MKEFISYKKKIFSVSHKDFNQFSLSLFRFQAGQNPIYKSYLDLLGVRVENIKRIEDIPFLPVSLFRNHDIKTGNWKEEALFESSGTTSQFKSKHYINDLNFYHSVSTKIFTSFYGDLRDYIFLILIPTHIERYSSSLISMISNFIGQSFSEDSGFYFNNHEELSIKIKKLKKPGQKKIILWGVTYALLDFAEQGEIDIKDLIIIETGGMKGRREEMVRDKVHNILINRFGVNAIHSEYGMTELLSQAYSRSNGRFLTAPWMKILIREINDPFNIDNKVRYGGVNIIDLANFHSCAFIETEDLGCTYEDGTFEIIGRMDNSELRGCNLLLN